jgi:GNAT superfamily N-acetyltransferase
MSAKAIEVRSARLSDARSLFSLIESLAEYERLSEQVVGSAEQLADHLFGPAPAAEAVVAEIGSDVVGFAVFFSTFSTFLCQPGLWVEDVYVSPEHRREGAGSALLAHIAALALRRNCGRLEWSALNWNDPALHFYARIGATPMKDWQILRVEGDALGRLASR